MSVQGAWTRSVQGVRMRSVHTIVRTHTHAHDTVWLYTRISLCGLLSLASLCHLCLQISCTYPTLSVYAHMCLHRALIEGGGMYLCVCNALRSPHSRASLGLLFAGLLFAVEAPTASPPPLCLFFFVRWEVPTVSPHTTYPQCPHPPVPSQTGCA